MEKQFNRGGIEMSELKTLNDFRDYPEPSDFEVSAKELKQEAIRWYHRSDGNKHKFIREFFNIKEEDLK